MEPGVGGHQAGERIDQVNAVAAGVAGGQHAIVLGHDALQGSARHGDGHDVGPDTGRRDLDHSIAPHGDVKVAGDIHRDATGIGEAGGICRHGITKAVKGDHRAVIATATVEHRDIQ